MSIFFLLDIIFIVLGNLFNPRLLVPFYAFLTSVLIAYTVLLLLSSHSYFLTKVLRRVDDSRNGPWIFRSLLSLMGRCLCHFCRESLVFLPLKVSSTR